MLKILVFIGLLFQGIQEMDKEALFCSRSGGIWHIEYISTMSVSPDEFDESKDEIVAVSLGGYCDTSLPPE